MKAQEIEDRSDVRIQFGYRTTWGLVPFAPPQLYDDFFSAHPAGWELQAPRQIKTSRSSHRHRAWVLTRKKAHVAAVEHETGLEVVAFVASITAIVQFTFWAYDRWEKKAKRPKGVGGRVEPVTRIERICERSTAGRERVVQTVEIRGNTDADEIAKLLKKMGRACR